MAIFIDKCGTEMNVDDGLFFFSAMLVYRSCRCCRRIWTKLLHTTFHLLAIPAIVIGFIAVWDSHQLNKKDGVPRPIPDFYSLHSWLGLATMGLFALQVVVIFIWGEKRQSFKLLVRKKILSSIRFNVFVSVCRRILQLFAAALLRVCHGLFQSQSGAHPLDVWNHHLRLGRCNRMHGTD